MGVSARHSFMAVCMLMGAGLGGWAAADGPAGKKPSSACCAGQKGHRINVPNVSVAGPNIHVSTPSVIVRQGNVSVGGASFVDTRIVIGGGSAGAGTFVSAGGSFFSPSPVPPSAITDLSVEGGEETYTELVTEDVPYEETVCVDQPASLVAQPVQAVCIDDKGAPHPASQAFPGEAVDADYDGELFRCVAGTRMQVTIGELAGGESTATGQTFACDKGEALVHAPGGALSCAPASPQRECNERSLLRRYGPGAKLVSAPPQGQCVDVVRRGVRTVTREVERKLPAQPGNIVLDGGVGQTVF